MAVEPQEVEPVAPISDEHHAGLVGMEAQAQTVEDQPHPPEPFTGLPFGLAENDQVVGIPDQLTQTSTAVLPEPIKLVEHHVREERGDHPSQNLANKSREIALGIPRTTLRSRYGDGFLGAPLRQWIPGNEGASG